MARRQTLNLCNYPIRCYFFLPGARGYSETKAIPVPGVLEIGWGSMSAENSQRCWSEFRAVR